VRSDVARTALLTAAALVAFAGNSLLCRLALAAGRIDAASFTGIRLASGALILAAVAAAAPREARAGRAGSWGSAAALFIYAAPFSYAYLSLGAGPGALILFGMVQATMLGREIVAGNHPPPRVWIGLVVAVGGLVVLTRPGRAAPDPIAAVTMGVAGIAWAVYTLRGRGAKSDPRVSTAGNFVRSVPFAVVLVGIATAVHGLHVTPIGALLAVASGALASGLGYTIWYAALRGLSATRAAVLQLLVPVLAAAGGVALLDEPTTARLLIGGAAILGGVALAALAPRPPR
jgi:drug/metabolite transporter (DMT)-like permease